MMPEEIQLRLLWDFLSEQDIPKSYYSIGKYSDEAVCIEHVKNEWIVYEGDRGNHYNETHHSNFCDAACQLLARVAESDRHEQRLTVTFKNIYEAKSTKYISEPVLAHSHYQSLRNMLDVEFGHTKIEMIRSNLKSRRIANIRDDVICNHLDDITVENDLLEMLEPEADERKLLERMTRLCMMWKNNPSLFTSDFLIALKPILDNLPDKFSNTTLEEIKEACELATRKTNTNMSDNDEDTNPSDESAGSPESDSK